MRSLLFFECSSRSPFQNGVPLAFFERPARPRLEPDAFGFGFALAFGLELALPLALAGYPLIVKAFQTLTSDDIGVKRVMGIVPLPGLCQWLTNERSWERVNENATDWHDEAYSWQAQRSAVEAHARRCGCCSMDWQ